MNAVAWTPPFNSQLVLDEHVLGASVRAYYVGFDQQKFRLKALAKVVADVIPEFAMGFHVGTHAPISELASRVRDAARRIYSTEKYQKRGEFGELILHLLLRDFFKSVPLISKIHFKDADNAVVHGFDGVHVVAAGASKQLWLGESKLYDDGKSGIDGLTCDLSKHLMADYLRREFALISPKLDPGSPDTTYWRQQLHENRKLEDIVNELCIPMVCTYSSPVFGVHGDNTPQCLLAFKNECTSLNAAFLNGIPELAAGVRIVLLLLPVESKALLVQELHEKLKAMQSI